MTLWGGRGGPLNARSPVFFFFFRMQGAQKPFDFETLASGTKTSCRKTSQPMRKGKFFPFPSFGLIRPPPQRVQKRWVPVPDAFVSLLRHLKRILNRAKNCKKKKQTHTFTPFYAKKLAIGNRLNLRLPPSRFRRPLLF